MIRMCGMAFQKKKETIENDNGKNNIFNDNDKNQDTDDNNNMILILQMITAVTLIITAFQQK